MYDKQKFEALIFQTMLAMQTKNNDSHYASDIFLALKNNNTTPLINSEWQTLDDRTGSNAIGRILSLLYQRKDPRIKRDRSSYPGKPNTCVYKYYYIPEDQSDVTRH
jgi:hypothetical protein